MVPATRPPRRRRRRRRRLPRPRLLRPVADWIVIGVDTRADADSVRDYATVADRVLPVRFEYLERHLAWLHEQCTGDWVLRLDTDEVPSAALLAALPALTARTDVQ